MTRETRDGWPVLTVETEVNGDSRSTNDLSFVGSLGLLCRYKKILFCFAALVGPVHFFLPYTISIPLSPS
jgi:hypothetical protein